ncbi:hypothetical protein MBLNU457_g0933t1 [Dothideomycetes sp. NU457]
MATPKSIHTIVLDTGAIIRNHPTVSSLIAQAEEIITVPAIISEIRDADTRSRVQTTLMPFLKLRSPKPNSIKFVTDFARRTGDLAVLSKPDIQIIALAYELECERNGGDWRLRRMPGQKGVNGAPPRKEAEPAGSTATEAGAEPVKAEGDNSADSADGPSIDAQPEALETAKEDISVKGVQTALSETKLEDGPLSEANQAPIPPDERQETQTGEKSDSDDDEGWITPSNLKKHQAKDANGSVEEQGKEQAVMQVATLTTDFAMQNVILQVNLNLLSPSFQRVKHLKTFVLRCHACFQTTKEMSKQFCPRCGKPTLTRVACSTTANGEFKLHLKKNMQWNTRGDRYSIPKAVHGSANGRITGGGKGGWGNNLMLAEDQKEYQRAMTTEKRTKERDLMDEDYLPGILTGDRGRAGGRIQVGAGRNVNSRKR